MLKTFILPSLLVIVACAPTEISSVNQGPKQAAGILAEW